MEKQIRRKYKISDDKMLSLADTFQTMYEEDKTDFEAFNVVMFPAGFGAAFLAAIDTARNYSNDTVVMYTHADKTMEFNSKHKECCNFFKAMKPTIINVFPDNEMIWNQFGFNEYKTVLRSKWKMITFMDVLFETATTYSAELIAGGFTAVKIAEIQTLHNELNEAQLTKEGKIKERPVSTHERISLYNKVWEIMRKNKKASKAVYRNNYAMMKKYALPYKKRKKKE